MGALRGHFSFFTMLRIDIDEDDMEAMDASFHLAPLVGLLYGLISGFGILILEHFVGIVPAVAAVLLAMHLFNRFLHMDGLMDVGDGLVVSGGLEDHLRALKDSRIGAGGVAFAFFVSLLTFSGLISLPLLWIPLIPLSIEILSRNSMVATAAFGRPGDGMAGRSVRLTGGGTLAKSTLISLLLAILAGGAFFLAGDYLGLSLPSVRTALIALAVGLVTSIVIGWILARVAHRNFGIVNGDMLGASNELSRALTLLAIIAVI